MPTDDNLAVSGGGHEAARPQRGTPPARPRHHATNSPEVVHLADHRTVFSTASTCSLCGGRVQPCLDFGRQPVSNAFARPEEIGSEVYFRLAVGICTECAMVQQLDALPRERMFRPDYPYRSSGSAVMRTHFEQVARQLLETELSEPDAFAVEIGSNDGIMLESISVAGVRHLGVDPSTGAAEVARTKGIEVLTEFFGETTAAAIREERGAANLVYSANTFSHIGDLDSILRGVNLLLAPRGAFVFEERYLGDIVANRYFDQIYDEHIYLFAVRSVQALAERAGFELVDVARIPTHGGSVRYTVARPGTREVAPSVAEMLAYERDQGLGEVATFLRLGQQIEQTRDELVALLGELRSRDKSVVGYGATSKSATVTNYCGIGPDLVSYICDSTVEKQGRLSPGSHIPVRSPEAFADQYPDYALLFAWNHADEIMAKERHFHDRGGRWILYVPNVHIR